jgi:hypothetical protein
MPKKSHCDETPDNCFPECVKCCVEKCKKVCCERKYLKLAHKLLDGGLFVDSANYVRQEVFSARTSSQFYNITAAFADVDIESAELQYDSDVIVNNQPNNLLSFQQLGFDAINVKEFDLKQLTTFSALGGDFTFIMDPVLTLIFGKTLVPGEGFDTLQNAIESASPSLSSPGNPALLAYLNSKALAVAQVLAQVLPGGLPQVILAQNTPYVTNVEFDELDPTVTPAPVSHWVGKAGLVSKLVNESSPCTTESNYFLVTAARRVVDRHGPIPGPCDL